LRRTTITQNHFITFTQNWRGKTTASVLLLSLIALFFSCKDDAAFIGLKKDPRLKVDYVDISLHPSVIAFSSILTQNVSTDQNARVLIGKYTDPRFGSIQATTYFNFSPPFSNIVPGPTATADSIVLELAIDYYSVGGKAASNQIFDVYELLDTLNGAGYYTNSTVPYASSPIASGSLFINPEDFQNASAINNDSDTTNDERLKIKIRIPGTLASDVLQDLIQSSKAIFDYNVFRGKYKGYALVARDCDKIFGINPTISTPYINRQSRIALYYTENSIQTHADLAIYPGTNYTTGLPNDVVSFTSYAIDRTGSPLAGIAPLKDFTPSDGYMYIQSGAPLITKLDLRDFYKFADTLEHAIINSAEIVTNNNLQGAIVNNVRVRILDSLGTFRNPYEDSLVNDVLTPVYRPIYRKFSSALSFGTNASSPTMDIALDAGVPTAVSTDTYQISTMLATEFCQKLVVFKSHPERPKWVAIIPDEEEFRKSLDALVLDNNITLRVYYSQPIIQVR
jgi:hypothetical protein